MCLVICIILHIFSDFNFLVFRHFLKIAGFIKENVKQSKQNVHRIGPLKMQVNANFFGQEQESRHVKHQARCTKTSTDQKT